MVPAMTTTRPAPAPPAPPELAVAEGAGDTLGAGLWAPEPEPDPDPGPDPGSALGPRRAAVLGTRGDMTRGRLRESTVCTSTPAADLGMTTRDLGAPLGEPGGDAWARPGLALSVGVVVDSWGLGVARAAAAPTPAAPAPAPAPVPAPGPGPGPAPALAGPPKLRVGEGLPTPGVGVGVEMEEVGVADPAPVVLDTVEMGVGDAMVDGDAAAGADTRAGGEGEGSRWPCPPACPCTTTRLAEGAEPPVGSGVVAGMGGVAPGVSTLRWKYAGVDAVAPVGCRGGRCAPGPMVMLDAMAAVGATRTPPGLLSPW